MLFHQLGLQEDMTIYVAVVWCGHTEPIKEERLARNVFEKWRLGNRLPWKLKKKKKKKTKKETLEDTI